MDIDRYNITGMSCAACQARVEKAVGAVEGVKSCSVSLLTNSMGVEGDADPKSIIMAVEKAGYGAKLSGGEEITSYESDELTIDNEIPVLKRRLCFSVTFLLVLMYFSMGHNMLSLPVFDFMANPAAIGVTQMLLALVVMFINRKFFISGARSLFGGAPNMDTLVALGSGTSFAYSLVLLYMIFDNISSGNSEKAMQLQMDLYFETAAMIPALITVGKLLEAVSKGKTTDALKSLIKLSPKKATILADGEERLVDIKQVKTGDTVIVRPGESVPVDALITEGGAAVDESALTGESVPVDKKTGDYVYAATINTSGYFKADAVSVGKDTALSRIIALVSDAAATKAPIARIADKVSSVFVPAVIVTAVLTFAVWFFTGRGAAFSIGRAISVVVISCPCALGLATPVAIMVGNGVGAKNGILFKTASSQETVGKIRACALDKTGTVTEGRPQVTEIIPLSGFDEKTFLSIAYSLEDRSDHPLANAISLYCKEKNISLISIDDFKEIAGKGVSALYDNKPVYGGSVDFISELAGNDADLTDICHELSLKGETPVLFADSTNVIGVIALSDTIKPDSLKAVNELKSMGVEVIMITGDNEFTAKAIASQAGIDTVYSKILPDGKERVVRELQKKYGTVAMVGDGINDAPALVRADVGMAIGTGTDIAVDSADIVLMKSQLSDVAAAVRLSRATIRNIHQNLFWAFFYNVVCIPLAAGFYSALFGLSFEMNPMVGAAAMSLSSFTVCMNALRLGLVDIHDSSKDKMIKADPNNDY